MAEERIRRQELIEQYLLGQLEGEPLQDFTLQLMRDQQLQKEVDAHRILIKSLWKNTTPSSTTKTDKPSNNIRKWGLLILGLAIVAIFTYWFSSSNDQNKGTTSEQTLPNTEEKNISPPAEIIDTPVIIEQEEAPQDSPEESQPQNNQKEQEAPISPPPIAANFDPNPALENYFGQLRGGELEINNPTQISTLTLDNGKVNFQLAGTFTADEEEVLTIHFFSNKKEDYEQFRPIVSEQLPLGENDEIEWKKEFELIKGLYYYQIEGENSGLLYVGKVEVRR